MQSKTLATQKSLSSTDAGDTTTSCTTAIADAEWTDSSEIESGCHLQSLVEVDEREIEGADLVFENREDDGWEDHHDGHGDDPGDGLGLEDYEWDAESHDSAFCAMYEMYGTQAGL
jgi:hypothetical protein